MSQNEGLTDIYRGRDPCPCRRPGCDRLKLQGLREERSFFDTVVLGEVFKKHSGYTSASPFIQAQRVEKRGSRRGL